MPFPHTLVLAFLPLLACACSSGGGGAKVDDWNLDSCGFAAPLVGLIDVSERSDVFHGGVYARVEAQLYDGLEPVFHAVTLEQGGCRHYQVALGSCDPPCSGGEVCSQDGACMAFPRSISGGTLKVTGLAAPVRIEPADWSLGTYLGPAGLPAALFGPGDPVGAILPGGAFPKLAIGASGVAVMDTDLTASGYVMQDGADAEITWTEGPDPDACVQVVLYGFNAVHGAPLSDIVMCEGPDTGSMNIPQAMVEAFPHGQTPLVTEGYDWPHSELTRFTRNTAQTGLGPAALVVRSTTYFQLSHPE